MKREMAGHGQGSVGHSSEPGSTVVESPLLYSNRVQIQLSSWDFNFEFAQLLIVPNDQEGQAATVAVNAIQRIVMSPQHAKAFLEILRQNVEEWEKQFGEIQLVSSGTTLDI